MVGIKRLYWFWFGSKTSRRYLSRQNDVVLLSSIEEEAINIIKSVGRSHVQYKTVDVLKEIDLVHQEIKNADVVLSLLPATMHVPIAKLCIKS